MELIYDCGTYETGETLYRAEYNVLITKDKETLIRLISDYCDEDKVLEFFVEDEITDLYEFLVGLDVTELVEVLMNFGDDELDDCLWDDIKDYYSSEAAEAFMYE